MPRSSLKDGAVDSRASRRVQARLAIEFPPQFARIYAAPTPSSASFAQLFRHDFDESGPGRMLG